MKIELKEITIKELFEGYEDNGHDGVVGYGGLLDIRPPYQREFIYKDVQRDAVIDTIAKGFPLNVMYWASRSDGGYEIIDGQQRTVSICQYCNGDFALSIFGIPEKRIFGNLQADEKQKILDYQLMVYMCSGSDSEKLEWFKTINIAGEKLTSQELRNAVYHGSWVSDAKKYFSKRGCPAQGLGKNYLMGKPIRQEYLETAIKWISDGDIEGYMASHQKEPDAGEIWTYFEKVIAWVKTVFPNYRKEMKGLDWGGLYKNFKGKKLDAVQLEEQIAQLMQDDDVTDKKGIYSYVLTGEESQLNIRAFSASQKRSAYEQQAGICRKCNVHFEFDEMDADHIKPWIEGGKTAEDNLQLLCKDCNRRKSSN